VGSNWTKRTGRETFSNVVELHVPKKKREKVDNEKENSK
jgi:hypothetical protein